MRTVTAVYEKGVFRPLQSVDLPDHSIVEFEPRLIQEESSEEIEMEGIYRVLSERFASGEKDVAARHNEHQP